MSHHTHPAFASLAEQLASGSPCALLENNLDRDGLARAFSGLLKCYVAWDAAEVPATLAAIEAASTAGNWITLAADFELGYALEPSLLSRLPACGRPLLSAWIWRDYVELDGEAADTLITTALELLPEDARTAGLNALNLGINSTDYTDTVSRIQALIASGDCYQVNFTFPLTARAYGNPLALYHRLRAAQPVRHGGFVRHASGTTLSHSPELFVARTGSQLLARPMKGTAPVGHADQLANSVKDRAENLMIVDLIRNDLGRLAANGGVRVERLFEIEDYATLHQMTSTVIAEPVNASLVEVFRALFPCGSVTGAPKIRAMEIIRELEDNPRGLYCGALGWLAPNGDFSFNVPIRTLEIDTSGNAKLGIGSGIVADSEPESEWSECAAKARFISSLTPEFELFETLRHEPDTSDYPMLAQHLARIARSATALGFPFDGAAAHALLLATAAELGPSQAHRVRLALSPNGKFSITHAPLAPLAAHPTVVISRAKLSASDPLLQHKTNRRALYDRFLHQVIAEGHFDALFFNEQGELCEGARSNVFLQIGGKLVTPPVRCGLLPGVMRQSLLEAGRAREAVLYREDLQAAEAVFVSNALRGLVAVTIWPESA